MNPKLREFLAAIRVIVMYISELTPTTYDDMIVTWIDFLLGEGNLPLHEKLQAQINIPWDKLPWDKIVPLIIPILTKLLEKWLASLGSGAPSLPSLPTGVQFNDKRRC